jgi:hypothetical protein
MAATGGLPMKLLLILALTTLISSCIDSALNEKRSVQCTMTFSDNCLATLSNGTKIWMNAVSSAETVVSYNKAEEECNQAAASHQYSGPHVFYFEGGNVKAQDALQAAGHYLFKSGNDVEFHYKKVGEADFRAGEETDTMTCSTRTNGDPHSY